MSVQRSIHQYYVHQCQLIEHCYKGYLYNPDPELVHQLRLGIKKLRALDILAGYLKPEGGFTQKCYEKNLKKLFKISGELRDIQVQIKMHAESGIIETLDFGEFGDWLLKREKKRILSFSDTKKNPENLCFEQPADQETGRILAEAGDNAVQEGARSALEGLFTSANKLLSGPISAADLHNLRKVTKQIRYIYSMVKHSFPGFEFEKISIEELREIEVAAGHWHDCLVRVELLAKFMARLHNQEPAIVQKYELLAGFFKTGHDEAYRQACRACEKGFRRDDS